VRSIDWHPDGQVLLTAGLDKRLRFFQARAPAVQSAPRLSRSQTGARAMWGTICFRGPNSRRCSHLEAQARSRESACRWRQVDGVRNPKVQSIFFEDMPIHQAAFASGGSHVRAHAPPHAARLGLGLPAAGACAAQATAAEKDMRVRHWAWQALGARCAVSRKLHGRRCAPARAPTLTLP